MDLQERLKKAQDKLQGILDQLQQLENQKNQLTQEALRLDGAIRELTLLRDEQGGKNE